MKAYKIRYIAIFLAIILLSQIGIQIINNSIADSVRSELASIPCPDTTIVEDSIFVAGKTFGNGNGMQYTGVILVRSFENKKRLETYYRYYYPECDVELLKSSIFDDAFSLKEISDTECYYVITLTREIESGTIPDTLFYRIISGCDIRGH